MMAGKTVTKRGKKPVKPRKYYTINVNLDADLYKKFIDKVKAVYRNRHGSKKLAIQSAIMIWIKHQEDKRKPEEATAVLG